MRPDRRPFASLASLARFAFLIACASLFAAGIGANAMAVTPEPEVPASTDAPLSGSFEAPENADADVPAPATPPSSVSLSGGANGSLVALGEAWTTWRYGRPSGRQPVNETSTRISIGGSGRVFEGLIVGFSVGLLTPSLHLGSYPSTTTLGAVWARHDRIELKPDIEWNAEPTASIADAGAASVSLDVTSTSELSHTSERRGDVTIDVTHLRLHGTLDAVLPCTRSGATWRQSCRPETLHGAF